MTAARIARLRREWNLQKVRALARYALRRAGEDRLPQVSASLTFTTVLAVVPVLTVAFALLAAFPVFRDFRGQIETFLFQNLIPGGNVSDSVSRYLGQFSKSARGLTALGLAGLMVTSVLTMLTVEDALNAIWRVKRRRPLAQRVLVFWAVLTLGPVLIGASLSVSSYLISVSMGYVGSMPMGMGLMVSTVPVMLSALAFAFLYMAVPYAYVDWRDAIVAGVVAAVAFEVAKRVFGYFITHIPTYTAVYGTFAVLPLFLLWMYVSWLVTLLGATIAANLPVIREGHWRRRTFAGSEFFDALGILLLLYRARDEVPRSVGELDMGRKLRMEADYLASLLGKLKTLHLVGKLQQDRGQAHWAMLCDPSQVTLRTLYDRLVLNLARLPRTALAHQLQGVDLLRSMLDNPQLDQPLEAVFRQQLLTPAANEAAEASGGTGDTGEEGGGPQRRTLEVVPPGWHGQV
ncbi:tRNA-processing RNAse BN [Cupriavidus sp. OV038]|jgi:membrane protein|uniref:YihY family inner membrane protein n=1 Tax=unclassified Cupriavidus TaxID=2640874 RepID=UPI0008E33890|nr:MULTISPECIES: YihY family inner membrane protein [unclassified Cupriavidus]SFB95334.1 tRNA-processing RNAse BN [Cupriavidus sp. OV038]SFO94996.1 tRNA-processing RNAse BN [Cupriavidus sp. OV096]